MLKGEMPIIDHLRVFGCGAFVYLPAMARANKMTPKLELMTYIGVAPGNERNFLFMRSTNVLFTAAHAIVDKCHFPHCPKNRHELLENPLGRINPKPSTSQLGNNPKDSNGDEDAEHDHGFSHCPVQGDDHKREANTPAPEEEPQQTPPCTPFPDVPALAPRMPSLARNLPPLAPQRPGQADCCQNAQHPMVNLSAHPQCECRVPVCHGNVYGEQRHPIEQLQDIESASRWRRTVGEASRPPQQQQLDSLDHVLRDFPDTSATPFEEDVEKMCEEGGANLVRFLMGKALTTCDPQYENVRDWSYRDITHLPQAEQKHWRLACQEELNMLKKHKVFEPVDRPRDWKVIKNQWVFDVKSDGHKK